MGNIGVAFPNYDESQRKQLAQEALVKISQNFLAMPAVWTKKPQWLANTIKEVEGIELIDDSHQQGKPLIVLFLHHGTWGVQCAHLSDYIGTALTVMAKFNGEYDGLLAKLRENQRCDAKVVPADSSGVRSLFKALKKNQIVAFSPDQVPDANSGEYAPFFGVNTLTMTLVYQLLQKTDANVLIGVAEQLPDGFKVRYLEPEHDIYSSDRITSLTALNRNIEGIVLNNPTEYLWAYKRFKNSLPPLNIY